MPNPSSMLNSNGTRTANIKWTVSGPESADMPQKIIKLAEQCQLKLVNISSKKIGFFKDYDEVTFKVFGIESNLHVFFSTMEIAIDKANRVSENDEPKPVKEGFFKRLFKR